MTNSKTNSKTNSPNYKLTKKDFNQINRRNLFTFQLGWNYERMQYELLIHRVTTIT